MCHAERLCSVRHAGDTVSRSVDICRRLPPAPRRHSPLRAPSKQASPPPVVATAQSTGRHVERLAHSGGPGGRRLPQDVLPFRGHRRVSEPAASICVCLEPQCAGVMQWQAQKRRGRSAGLSSPFAYPCQLLPPFIGSPAPTRRRSRNPSATRASSLARRQVVMGAEERQDVALAELAPRLFQRACAGGVPCSCRMSQSSFPTSSCIDPAILSPLI